MPDSCCTNAPSVTSPFVTKLNAAGNALIYSTCFGANGSGNDIAVDGTGRVHLAGRTSSNTFPQVNALQTYGGGGDAYALTLNAAGNTLAFSTFLGGSAAEGGVGVATDGADKTYVVGSTISTNFPVQNAYQPQSAGGIDAFVLVINDAAPVATNTPTVAPTSTNSPTRTSTSTVQPTSTRTFTPTPIATGTSTNTPLATSTPTATFTAVPGNLPPVVTVPLNRPYRVGVEIGNYLALRFDAYDPDDGDIVSMSASGLPPGSSFPVPAPGNPIYSTFTWRPTASDIGTYYVTITATDSHGAQDAATVQIDVVAGCVPYFSDVFPGQYFYPAVQFLYCNLIVSGYLEPDLTFTFRPFNNTTRGQFSKMIVGAYNLPPYDPPTPDFDDVPTTNPFYSYIEAAYNAGIISGYADRTFHPFASITRGQLSKLVVRAAGWPIDTSGGPHFSDVPDTYTFYEVIETAYNHGVISGYACGSAGEPCDVENHAYFRPGNTAIRGQISKILWLALGSPPPR